MKKRFVSLILLLLTGLFLFLNAQKTVRRNNLQQYKEALRLYDLEEPTPQTDSLALQYLILCAQSSITIGDARTATDCYIKAGNIHQTYQQFALSNQYYHRSLALNKATLKDGPLQYEALLYLGSSFYFSNVIDSAQLYFEAASAIAYANTGKQLPEQARLYNSLGAIYFESANYLQAKNYFEKAQTVTSPALDDDYEESLIGIQSNIANCLLRLNQFDSALSIYKALLLVNSQKETSAIIQQNTAHTYFELGYYDSSLAIYKNLSKGNALNRVKALNDIGRIYMSREQWQQAEMVFDSAIAGNKKIAANIKNKDEALAYLYRGQLADRQGLTDEAITWCNEALQEVHFNFRWKGINDFPEDVSQSVSPVTLFEILRTKAQLLYKKYKHTNQQPLLTAALFTYCKAIQAANFVKLNFDNDEAKLFFNRNYQPIYSEAIAIAYDCTMVDEVFIDQYIFILENYKGNILYQNLQRLELKSTANLPDSIKRREKEIQQLLAFYTSRINNNATEKDAGQLKKRLLELQVELSRLQKQYDNDEAYNLYRNRSTQNEYSLASVQRKIDDETALVNYYISGSTIFMLAINKKEAVVEKVEADSVFSKNIASYLNETYRHAEGERYGGQAAAAYLYRSLILPLQKVVTNCSKWVIIPDGLLYYLPVESLVTSEAGRDYVVQSKTVSYHYSFALLLQANNHHNHENDNNELLGLAPFTESDAQIATSGLAVLPFSKSEMQLPGNNIFVAKEATKQRFLEKSAQHSVIHLATHASTADSTANWIQFYPADSNDLNNKLFIPEIYNLNLHQTSLVILSACETAGGIASSGDGLLSLSRAFIYAGTDGIISTLWKTEDQVTAYLMQQLHRHLKKNISPEKALQLAKIDLLNNAVIGSQYKTPNYWANFIYVGKVVPVKSYRLYVWLLVSLLFSATAYFLYRKFKGPEKKQPSSPISPLTGR